jgi:hypothetical protein
MTTSRPNPILRLMPSLTDMAFLMPIVFLFGRMQGVRTLLGDGDTGWHVRTGEWMLDHGQIPRTDMFSFTKAGQPFFAWEWGWDLIFAWLHRQGGMGLVVLVNMLILCSIFALLYRLVNRSCGNPVVAIGATVLAMAGSTIHWLARPHLFTLLFIVVFLSILQRVREGRTKLLWSLPAITVLWTNLHGGFPAGILILGAYAGGEVARALAGQDKEERMAALRASIPYMATAAGCLAASLVNPYFYHLHVHIWEYLRDPSQMKNINEFQGTNFQGATAGFFEAMLVLGLCAAIWYGAKKRFGEIFLLAGWAHLALLQVRNIPIFMIVAAPVIAPAVVAWLKALANAPVGRWIRESAGLVEAAASEIAPFENVGRAHVLSAVVLGLVGLGMYSPTAGEFLKPVYNEKTYPWKALAMLDAADRVFTHDEWGDYLIYHLSPKGRKVYVDGRSDFYGGKFFQEYVDLMNVKYDWEQKLERYQVDTILLPPDAPLASAIKESRHWRVVYDDGDAIVFRAANMATEPSQPASTSTTGGRGSDLRVALPQNVVLTDHVSNP